MQASVAELSPVVKQLNVVVEGDRLIKELDKAYRKLSGTAKIKGFRQGKIPRQVLERYFRQEVEREVIGKVLSDAYSEAVKTTQIEPIANPEIQAGEFVPGQDFQFSAKVEVRPTITLKSVKGLSATRIAKKVDDETVENEIKNLQQQMATIQPVTDRETAEKGDLCSLNFLGLVDDAPFQGGTGSSYVVEPGAGRFFKEVEDALPGKKVGEQFSVDLKIPDDFRAEAVRGKAAKMSVTVVELKKRVMPALDDEFAKDVGDYENLADLRTKLRAALEKRYKDEADRDLTEALMSLLIEGNPFDLPPSMVERQIDNRILQQLSRIPPQQLQRMSLNRERLREDARDAAIRQVRGALLLEAVAKQENLTVSEEDVEQEFARLAELNSMTVDRVRGQFAGERRDDLKTRLKTDKAIGWLKQNADITEKTA
ncbi:MAG: trigger factor [Deltaproteobacteria bacterium]|nr:trigger factor [Deltaproteobacteria bacterium]